jgi:hypothetical protein
MSGIYLGDSGKVELRRYANDAPLTGVLVPEDVNANRRRFSVTFDTSALITGDQLKIERTDGGDLELVQGHAYPDGQWFCHVDATGGVRLFDNFDDAINGEEGQALLLVAPSTEQEISVEVINRLYRCLGNITEWQLTTNRDAVDLTGLGEEHRRFYTSGLMSGQGSLQCFWNHEQTLCDGTGSESIELPHYLAQLVLRCQLGAGFLGHFYIKTGEQGFAGVRGAASDTYIWWECEAVVTNVGMVFSPGRPVQTSIEFITTGPVNLRMGTPPSYLLQEEGSLILQEDGSALLLEDD